MPSVAIVNEQIGVQQLNNNALTPVVSVSVPVGPAGVSYFLVFGRVVVMNEAMIAQDGIAVLTTDNGVTFLDEAVVSLDNTLDRSAISLQATLIIPSPIMNRPTTNFVDIRCRTTKGVGAAVEAKLFVLSVDHLIPPTLLTQP
jgi:hypothetical protein